MALYFMKNVRLFFGLSSLLVCLSIDQLMPLSIALSNESADVFFDFLLSLFSYLLLLFAVFFMWKQTLVSSLCFFMLFFVNFSNHYELVRVIEGKIHSEVVYFENGQAEKDKDILSNIKQMQSFKLYLYPFLAGLFLIKRKRMIALETRKPQS